MLLFFSFYFFKFLHIFGFVWVLPTDLIWVLSMDPFLSCFRRCILAGAFRAQLLLSPVIILYAFCLLLRRNSASSHLVVDTSPRILGPMNNICFLVLLRIENSEYITHLPLPRGEEAGEMMT